MASVMELLRHRVRLVEELLEASVVDAQDATVDEEVFQEMMEVYQVLFKTGAA